MHIYDQARFTGNVYSRVPIKNEGRIFLTALSEILWGHEVMRKQRVQNLGAIEVYLEVAQVDFMLPLD